MIVQLVAPGQLAGGVKSCYVLFGLFVSNYLTGVPVNYVDKLSHRHLFEALDNTANYRTCG